MPLRIDTGPRRSLSACSEPLKKNTTQQVYDDFATRDLSELWAAVDVLTVSQNQNTFKWLFDSAESIFSRFSGHADGKRRGTR